MVYVARNPKDVAVSYYHHNINLPNHGYIGSFEQFLTFFEQGLHLYGDYWTHVKGGWELRKHENFKFLWFEDMKVDQKKVIVELCSFLNHPLDDDQINRLVEHVKFENMKNNPWADPGHGLAPPGVDSKFMRKGQVGDWKNYFEDDKNQKWKTWILQNIKGTGMEDLDHFKNV